MATTSPTERATAASRSPAATATKPPPPPPIAHWVSPALLSFIDYTPENTHLRGMIRAELNLITPKDPPLKTTEEIKNWLIEHFDESTPGPTMRKGMAEMGSTYRLYNPEEAAAAARRGAAAGQPLRAAAPEAPRIEVEPDGSFVMDNFRVEQREYGTALYETTSIVTGMLRIPGHVVAGGPETVRAFMQEAASNLDANPTLEENTENYIYGRENAPNIGWAVERRELVAIQINEEALRQATARRNQV